MGGALLLTASLAVISNAFAGADRTRAFAFWGAALGIALAIGPVLGGVITNLAGWRWVFLVNIPASAVLIVATLRTIEESSDPQAKRLDFAGIVTFSLGLAMLIWALINGNDAGWTSAGILGRIATAAVLLTTFVVVELRQQRPMVDFLLFRRSTFLGAVLAMVGYGLSAQVMVFLLPLALQNAYGLDPLWAGVAMIPFAVPMVVAPRVTTALAARFSGRSLLTVGLTISCVGNVLFWLVARAHLPYPAFAFGMLVAGCGAGLLNGQTVKVLQGAVPPERAGMASGIASTTRFIGILVSVAVLGAILSNVARLSVHAAATSLGLEPAAAEAAAKLVTSGDLSGLVANAPEAIRDQLNATGLHAYGAGFAAACALAAILAMLSAILAFVFLRREDTAPKGVSAPGVRRPCKYVDCRDPL